MTRDLRTALTCVLATAFLAAASAASAADKQKVVEPFNGKDLSGWVLKQSQGNQWVAGIAKTDPVNPRELAVTEPAEGEGQLVNKAAHGVDIYTEQKFGDCIVTLELMVPKGSNSGVYLMGNYEVQVLDSFGKEKVGAGDIGGLYGAAAPLLNAAKAPGEWQEFVIEFQAPRFENGNKVANAVFKKVTLNGKVIHENVEMKGITGGSIGGGEKPTGPLMFQGNHGPVAYRNIKIAFVE